jgi:2-polyprenyl-6-methoxyphenol hydroxylase-like FAD-dependent oxidoreductase
MLAGWLARCGVIAKVVDAKSGPTDETRAVGIQARTLELWDRLGLTEQVLPHGRIAEGMTLWSRGRKAGRAPLGEMGKGLSPHPYLFLMGQDQTERFLLAHLEEHGGSVEWKTELTGLALEGGRAIATLNAAKKVQARFVCGCDGARSAVRRAIGVGFPGGTYESLFFVADVTARGGIVPGEINVALFEERFLTFFPLAEPDRYRFVGLLPPTLTAENASPETVLPDARRLMRAEIEDVRWFSTYRVHHRVADRFQVGCAFLLGDAGHVHSPVGAQGMNTGLQDAANLAWKLAEVLRHGANERLLTTYETERIAFAQSLVKTTDRIFSAAVGRSSTARFTRSVLIPRLFPALMRLPFVRRAGFGVLSQIDVSYPDSPLSVGPGAGERMPWHEFRYKGERPDRWSLHIFGPEPAGAEAWAKARGLGIATWANEQPQAVLVRPDGYIGYSSPAFEAKALDGYLRDVVGRRMG